MKKMRKNYFSLKNAYNPPPPPHSRSPACQQNFWLRIKYLCIVLYCIAKIPYLLFGETTSHLTIKWTGILQYVPQKTFF